jgi:hypothetical protein
MSKFQPKAEIAFQKKMQVALANRDFVSLEKVFHQYGCYLELIDSSVDLTHSQIADHSEKMVELKKEEKS